MCVYVCASAPRLLIVSGVMLHDMNPYDWLTSSIAICGSCSQFVVRLGLRIESRHRNHQIRLALHKSLLSL